MSKSSNVSEDLKEYIEDYIESFLYPLTYSVIGLLPGLRTKKNTLVLTSSGFSVTVVPAEFNYVLQGYRRPATYNKLIRFYEHVKENPDPRTKYIVQGQPVAPGIFAYKKLHPLNDYAPDLSLASHDNISRNVKEIKHDIGNAIAYLHSISVRHGDTRVDNIGYDLDTKNFVLFDFDKINLSSPISREAKEDDLQIFEESLRYAIDH